MPHELSVRLPRAASAAAVARRAVDGHLAGALPGRRVAELKLVVSELVTNAFLHGRGDITLRLQLDGSIVRSEIVDQGGGFEREVRERGPDDVGGRGLVIVEALASRWGIHEGTTHVWLEIDLDDPGGARVEPQLGANERPDGLDEPAGEVR